MKREVLDLLKHRSILSHRVHDCYTGDYVCFRQYANTYLQRFLRILQGYRILNIFREMI